MILSDRELRSRLANGELIQSPVADNDIQPASIDLHLGDALRDSLIGKIPTRNGASLPPGSFLLGTTREVVAVPHDLVAVVDGKSTNARRGLMIHVTAGYIDPGFVGEVTLELVNLSRQYLTLDEGMKIAQIRFHALTSPAERPYGSEGLGSKYQDQRGPTAAR